MPRCLRCQRLNPTGANYCYFDGTSLGPTRLPPHQFALPWTFTNRQVANTMDDFVRGCLQDWPNARIALTRREFQSFFQSIQRPDLASLIPTNESDADIALQQFLERLQSTVTTKPSLDVMPRRLHLKNVDRRQTQTTQLQIMNRGAGLLHGKATLLNNVKWLTIPTPAIKTRQEQTLKLNIDPHFLPKTGSFMAKIKLETNGGVVEIPVQVDVSEATIFFSGYHIVDAIDLAKLMLQHPKQAVEWLHTGAVQHLFQQQGWAFPIAGPLAPQLGAVQQYFDAYRLSVIPKIDLSEELIETTCAYPERVSRTVTLSTTAKKWVYATASSDDYWLKPLHTIVAGPKQVDYEFEIDSGLLQAGRKYEGVLNLTVNGGIVIPIVVRVDIRRPFEPWTRKIFRPFTG